MGRHETLFTYYWLKSSIKNYYTVGVVAVHFCAKVVSIQSKNDDKDQETIQSSTAPDLT